MLRLAARPAFPYGWVEFCQRYKGECAAAGAQAADVNLTESALREIQAGQLLRQPRVEPCPTWIIGAWSIAGTIPVDGKGDCEDYALMKRKILIDRGFPVRPC